MKELSRLGAATMPSAGRPITSPAGGSTLQQWIDQCVKAAHTPATFYAGARKIIRPYSFVFPGLDSSLKLSHAGFTSAKLKALTKHYLHEESRRVAVELWEKRRGQENYGSVGFSCYNHLKKGDVREKTPRGSVFGPCLQSVIITHLDRHRYHIDVFYRTTELLKKFAPDVVLLRDVLLEPFDFDGMTCNGVNFHFANLTCHSMYIATLFPLVPDPIAMFEDIRKKDLHFYNWAVRWSSRYLLSEHAHGIQKFSQALRVSKDVNERLDNQTAKKLKSYLRKSHPGYGRTFKKAFIGSDSEDID